MQSQSEINTYILKQLKQLTESTAFVLEAILEMRTQLSDLQEIALLLQKSSTHHTKTNRFLLAMFAEEVTLSERAIRILHERIVSVEGSGNPTPDEVMLRVQALLKSM